MFFMRLAWRSLRRDRARFLSATFGVAAAVALLCWHVGLAMTAIHAGDGAAQKATAPFSAWLTGPADGQKSKVESRKSKLRFTNCTLILTLHNLWYTITLMEVQYYVRSNCRSRKLCNA
jgi:hypothetical protein